jgi:tetratricopeptide (TPR) repeat protein
MPGWLFGWINRLRARDIVGNVIVGGNSGIVYQVSGAGPPPPPPTVPWAEALPETGSPFEIFNLLSWKSRLVKELHGREAEKHSLLEWAQTGPRLRIRFLTGPGGAGKTRLAAEVAEALTGWHAGFAPVERATTLPLSQSGLFIILDYPEAWPKEVESLLREAARMARPPAPIRLLLLSRRPVSEWSRVIDDCGATTLCDAHEVGIGVLPSAAALSLFRDAATRLAAHRRRATPVVDETAFVAWLRQEPDLHALPLFVTAAAIHLVDEPTNTLGLRAGGIVDALVRRERKHLDGAGKAAGFQASGGSRLVGLAALRDGLNAAALRRLAAPELEIGVQAPTQTIDATRAARLMQGDRVFAPAPDIVAAELLRQVIVDAGDRGPAWVWETLSDPGSLQVELIDRRLHDIVTLHGPAELRLRDCMVASVTGRPERAQIWRVLSDSIERSFRLSPVSAAVGRGLWTQTQPGSEQRGHVLNNLSLHLRDAGDNAGALAVIREAVEIRRRLAQENAARFAPDLAGSLNNLSIQLSDAGDNAGALAAIREAVEIYRRLAPENAARFAPDLAGSLNNLSNELSAAGDTAGALVAIREAVEIRRRLAQENAARFAPDLATSLNNLSNRLSDAGDNAGALAAIRDAVEIRRRLAQENAARFGAALERSLDVLKRLEGDRT